MSVRLKKAQVVVYGSEEVTMGMELWGRGTGVGVRLWGRSRCGRGEGGGAGRLGTAPGGTRIDPIRSAHSCTPALSLCLFYLRRMALIL